MEIRVVDLKVEKSLSDKILQHIKRDYVYIVCLLVLTLMLLLTVLSASNYQDNVNSYWDDKFEECGCLLCPVSPGGYNESYDVWDPSLLFGDGVELNERR